MARPRTAPQHAARKTSSEGRVGKELAFCPRCYASIPVSADTCKFCGADLEEWRAQDYADRLIHALGHPLDDVRMRAIIALAWRREEKAERALVECALRHPLDVVEGLEIVESLRLIGETVGQSDGLRSLARDHPAKPVREAARAALRTLGGPGRESTQQEDSNSS